MGKALSGKLSCPCDRSCFPDISLLLLDNLDGFEAKKCSKMACYCSIYVKLCIKDVQMIFNFHCSFYCLRYKDR